MSAFEAQQVYLLVSCVIEIGEAKRRLEGLCYRRTTVRKCCKMNTNRRRVRAREKILRRVKWLGPVKSCLSRVRYSSVRAANTPRKLARFGKIVPDRIWSSAARAISDLLP